MTTRKKQRKMKKILNETIPMPVNPILLGGRWYYANYAWDRSQVQNLVEGNHLTPQEGLDGALWLARINFYQHVGANI